MAEARPQTAEIGAEENRLGPRTRMSLQEHRPVLISQGTVSAPEFPPAGVPAPGARTASPACGQRSRLPGRWLRAARWASVGVCFVLCCSCVHTESTDRVDSANGLSGTSVSSEVFFDEWKAKAEDAAPRIPPPSLAT